MAALSPSSPLAHHRVCVGQRRAGGHDREEPEDGAVTFIVLRSGRAELGQWLTERRNVAEDYERGFGEAPANPAAIAISIDSDDTHPMAESFLGVSQFR
jgi:Protein of unknown function (DUF3047)